jgi:hypothetical protein
MNGSVVVVETKKYVEGTNPCVSKQSTKCFGIGNDAWGGMCSNCSDLAHRPNSITTSGFSDWRDNMPEATHYENEKAYLD